MPSTAAVLFVIGLLLIAGGFYLALGAWQTGRNKWDLLDVEIQHWHDVDPTLIEDQWVGDDLTPLYDQDEIA